jgi:ketosteroid isomerase-like protein
MPWYHEFFGPAFKYFNVEGKFYDENFIASGNMVIHRYSYQMNLTPKEGGETLTEVGHGIKIYQRSTDGNWKMLYDVWSNPE